MAGCLGTANLFYVKANRGHRAQHLADVQLVEDRRFARGVEACSGRPAQALIRHAICCDLKHAACISAPDQPCTSEEAAISSVGAVRSQAAILYGHRSPSITTRISRLPNSESNIFLNVLPIVPPLCSPAGLPLQSAAARGRQNSSVSAAAAAAAAATGQQDQARCRPVPSLCRWLIECICICTCLCQAHTARSGRPPHTLTSLMVPGDAI